MNYFPFFCFTEFDQLDFNSTAKMDVLRNYHNFDLVRHPDCLLAFTSPDSLWSFVTNSTASDSTLIGFGVL